MIMSYRNTPPREPPCEAFGEPMRAPRNRAEFGRFSRDFRPLGEPLPDLNRTLMSAPLGGERSQAVGNLSAQAIVPQTVVPQAVSCIICAYNEADRIGRV